MRSGSGLGRAAVVGGWQAMVVQQYRDGGGARAVRALAAAGVIAVTAGCFGGDGGGGAGDGSGQRAVAADRA
ncbi:hypothetical protein B5180_40835, partial [Streptomyces sp. BF-3]